MSLSTQQINTLLSRKRGRASKTRTGMATVRLPDGTLDKVALSMIGSPGQFEGKQGTVKRSRKGATRIQANGRRYFVQNYDHDVVWYKV